MQPRPAVAEEPVSTSAGASESEPEPAAAAERSRRWWLVVPVAVLTIVAALVQLRSAGPERVTLGAGGVVGAGGTGVTSDRSVTDLERRWLADGSDLRAPEHFWGADVTATPTHVLVHAGNEIVAIDPGTTEELWRMPDVHVVPGAPTEELLVISGDDLARVDPATSRVTDRIQLDEAVGHDQVAVVTGDTVVSASPVRGFDQRTGEVRWRSDQSRLVSVRGSHGVVRRQESYSVLDLESGDVMWDVPDTSAGQLPVLLEDLLVVAGEPVTAYDLETGEPRWKVDDVPEGAEGVDVRVQDGLLLAHWHYIPGRTGETPPWTAVDATGRTVPMPATATPGTALLTRTAGTWIHVTGATVAAERDGQVRWRRELEGVQQIAAAGAAVLVGMEGRNLLLDVETGEDVLTVASPTVRWDHAASRVVLDDCLVSFDVEGWTARLGDGEPCWTPGRQVGPAPYRVLPGDGVVMMQSDMLRALTADGEERWTIELGRQQPIPLTQRWVALVDDQRLYARDANRGEAHIPLLDTRTGRTPAQLTVDGPAWGWVGRDDVAAVHLSDHDGQDPRVELWELPTDDRPQARRRWTVPHLSGPLRLEDDRAVRVAGTTLTELDLDDGTVRRRVPLEVRIGPFLALHADVLVATTTSDRLVGLDRSDGSLLWEVPLTGPVADAPTIAGDVAYVTVRPRHVVAVDINDGGILDEVETSAHVAGAAVVAGQRLLVPTHGGLEAFGPELPVG